MTTKKHIHKYHQVEFNGSKIWACALSEECTHYMPKHLTHLVVGRKSFCWECGEEIILDILNMRDELPRCRDCNSERNEALKKLKLYEIGIKD